MRDRKKERERVTRRSGTRMGGGYDERGAYDRRREEERFDPERDERARERDRDRHADERGSYREQGRVYRPFEQPRDERDSYGRREAGRQGEHQQEKREQTEARPPRKGNPDRTVHQLVPYAMLCLAPFAIVSFVLRDLVDGTAGAFGSFLADFLCGLLGVVGYILPIFMLVLAIRWRRLVTEGLLARKLLLSTTFLLLLSAIIHVFQNGKGNRSVIETMPSDLYANGVSCAGGGFFGGFFGEWLGKGLGLVGTIILAIPLLLLIGIYLVGLTPQGLWERISCKIRLMRESRDAKYAGKEAPAQKPEEMKSAPEEDEEEQDSAAGWCQPRPIEGLSRPQPTYVFREEEDEPIPAPTRRPAPQPASRPAPPRPTLLDIPDDEPAEAVFAPAPTPTPISRPAPAAPDPVTVLRDAAAAEQAPMAGSAAAPAPAEPEEQGYVYAPFALPVRPFPKKERREPEQAPVTPLFGTPVAEPRQEPTPSAANHSDEEVLGADRSRRPFVMSPQAPLSTPVTEKAPASPSPFAFDAPRAEDVRSEPAPLYAEKTPSFAREDVTPPAKPEPVEAPPAPRGIPVTPFSALPEQDAAEEEAFELPTEEFEEAEEQAEDSFAPSALFDAPKASAPRPDILFDAPEDPMPRPEPTFEEPVAPAPRPASAFDFSAPAASASASAYYHEPPAPVGVAEPVPVSREPLHEEPVVQAPAPVAPAFQRPEPVRPAVHAQRVETDPVAEQPPVIVEYKRPTLDLLNEDKNIRTEDFYEEIEETKDILRQTMASFNIKIQDEINYSHGPSVTRYEMRPVAGTSVRSVTNRTEDIALNLASSVRIEAPIPGKPAIGIEVPNKVRETVYMRTMLESEQFRNSREPLEVPLGLDVGGAVRMCNLAKMPHLLVAGTTGSGKSVCINSILVSLIYKTSPEDLRLILIDPKQIEFAPYEHVPHLYMPIVTDMQRAAGALACAVQEMERRFSLIKDVGVRNIEAYNEAVRNDPEREHLPYIIIVIDEFADLKMSCNNNDPENFTCRIAQKARAAGIHLIIGTQRPSVDVITGKLKTNIPSRIAFMVKQQVDSRTILDANGAESLTGRGDMLYMPTNSNDKQPVRIQGAFVSDGELDRVITYVKKHNAPVQYNRSFMDQIEAEMARAAKSDRKGEDFDYEDEDEGGEDPKFLEAVELAVQTQKVATSLLQRRLGVGYGRAAKIIDRMEELGLVSAPEGNKPRKLLPAAQGYLDHMAGGSDDDEADFPDEYEE